MNNKIIISLKIFAALLIIAGIFLVTTGARKNYAELQTLLSDTINHYEIVVTDQGKQINIQTQKVASLDNAIAAGLVREDELKEKNLKQLDHIIRLENRITMLEIEIALPDSNLIVVTDTITVVPPGSYLKVPTNFFYSEEWLRMTGVITGPQIVIRELQITTKPSIFIGYQKTGLFKPLRPVVTVEDLNPYLSTISMENVVIRQKPPFYKRPWWHRFEGAAIVIGAQILLNKTQ
jgi:hypothetical protein